MPMTRFSSISLFSGAGGLDLGLEEAGFETRAFVEIDRHARETLDANRGWWKNPSAPILSDVREIGAEQALEAAGLQRGAATLVAGGPPCQTFSTAGRRGSVGDPRGTLLAHFARLIAGISPRFFVFENVRGLLSAAIRHRPLHLRGNGASPIEEDEELGSVLRRIVLPLLRDTLGYEVAYGLVNAANYGVPQSRERVIFVGSRDHELGSGAYPDGEMPIAELLSPSHSRNDSLWLPPWRTLGEALEGLNDTRPDYIPYSAARSEVLALVPPGKNWRYLRDTKGHAYLKQIMGGAYDADGGKVGFWRRLSFERPSPTVPASPIQKGTSLCHPLETRPLSVREYARVQEFPDRFAFRGSLAERYKQIGNAVPVGLARAIGVALLRVIAKIDAQGVEEADAAYAGAKR
jgi:DNA (cytosine-5)-methyltransferase 1